MLKGPARLTLILINLMRQGKSFHETAIDVLERRMHYESAMWSEENKGKSINTSNTFIQCDGFRILEDFSRKYTKESNKLVLFLISVSRK